MAWVRLDDQAPRNAKLLKAGPAAAWMWVCCIAHCQAHASGGFIEDIAIQMVGIRGAERSQRLAKVLVYCGLLDRVSDVNRSGFMVHDYLDFNDTREEALARRADLSAKRAKAGRNGGLAKVANAKQTVLANPSPDPTRPDLSKNPLTPFQGERITRADRKRAKDIRRQRFGRCHHEPECKNGGACVELIARELAQRRRAS